jgi:hypothetical protein
MPIRLFLMVLLIAAAPAAALARDEKDKGTFVTVDTLTATVLAANGRRQVMTVQAGVDVIEPKLRAYAEASEPRLRDAFTQELQAYASGMLSGTPPDIDYLCRRLQGATDRVLGKPGGRFLVGGIMVN